MNSAAKYVPVLVFTIGAVCLAYSMAVFFHSRPQASGVRLTRTAAPARPEPGAVPEAQHYAPPAQTSGLSSDWLTQQNEFAQKTAKAYLKNAGLSMKLPDNVQFGQAADGPVDVLMGATGSGKIGLYLFTMNGKHSADKAKSYLEDFFKADPGLHPAGKGAPYNSRGGFNMTAYKGRTKTGDEFQAYFFKNGKHTHVLFMTDKNLSRHPAATQSIVDSLSPAR